MNGDSDDENVGARENTGSRDAAGAGAPRPRPSSGARRETKHHHLNKSARRTQDGSVPPSKRTAEIQSANLNATDATPKEHPHRPIEHERDPLEDRDRSRDPSSAAETDPWADPDAVPLGPPVEDEGFTLRKKRLELVIEEKEWSLESAIAGEDKMVKIVEYVNAVEAYKDLCSTRVPNTVSDLLSRYVRVYRIFSGSPGYQDALEFLCLGEDAEDAEDAEDRTLFGLGQGQRATSDASSAVSRDASDREGVASPDRASRKRDSIDNSQVDDIIRALAGDAEAIFGDDAEDDEDDSEDDSKDAARRLLRDAASKEGPGPLHCAQDVDGRWRWLEDDLGRALERKPEGCFSATLMSVEEMVTNGLNVNSLHEEVDPAELVNFAGCRSWEDVMRVGREVEAALEHMKADGWEVDTRSWCNEADALMVVKELSPLRTMSYVEGRVSKKNRGAEAEHRSEREGSNGNENQGVYLRGENNVVNNVSENGEKTQDDESLAA
jgi:hypothetical protein